MKLANFGIGLLALAAVPIALTGCMKPSAIRAPIGGIVLKSQRIEIPLHTAGSSREGRRPVSLIPTA